MTHDAPKAHMTAKQMILSSGAQVGVVLPQQPGSYRREGEEEDGVEHQIRRLKSMKSTPARPMVVSFSMRSQ